MKIQIGTALLLAATFLVAGRSEAQQRQMGPPPTRIGGEVADADTREPVETASIAVWSAADSSLVTGAITNEDGEFSIEGVRPGPYYVRVSFVGYVTETVSNVELRPGSWSADLGTIALRPDTQQLDEVVVEEERDFVQIGIDKTVYNTKDQLVTAGGNASDVLQEIPSVEVDIDGNISLRGNQNVAVLINGRPTAMTGEALVTFLQGLPASSVESVEVIPNPSAKYEPDGMSGILNIVLSKDQDRGLGGSLTAGVGTQGSYNASGSMNYQKGKFSTFSNYGFRHSSRDFDGDRLRENRIADPLTILTQNDEADRGGFSHNVNATVDYSIADKSTLSLAAVFSYRTGESTGLNMYRLLDADRDLTSRYSRSRDGSRRDLNQDYRLTYSRIAEPGRHELTAEVRYEHEDESDESLYIQQDLAMSGEPSDETPLRQMSEQTEFTNEISGQVDYVRPLLSGKMEAGYKGSLEDLDSELYAETFDYDTGGFLPETGRNNQFDYREQIHAGYGIVSQELGRFNVQVGVRLEQAMTQFDLLTTNETFKNDYFSVFPSAFATYSLQESQTGRKQLKLSYSKRVNRPNTWQLNPFDDMDDPEFRREGNPYLNPEYTHSMEASYIQFSGPASLTITPYYRKTVDQIRWYEFMDDEGVSIVTFRNFDSSDSWGAETIGTLRLSDWLNAHASFNAFRMQTDGSNVETDLSNDAWGWSARGNATINVQEGLDVQLSYFYRAPMDIENGRIGSFSMANLGVRQQLWDRKASLSLQVRDPFATMGFNVQREDERFYQESFRSFNSRELNLTFTYNFGNQDQQRRRRGQRQEADEDMQEMQMP